MPTSLDVRRYDQIVRLLSGESPPDAAAIAACVGVDVETVEKVLDGRLPRPPVVLLDRLSKPRRCASCGAQLTEWPCITCEIRRRRDAAGSVAGSLPPLKFKYRSDQK